ncbi:MAG: hypothetical protein CVV28_06925 [Methanobacteriales archaeon HGW-Methanobacteriales-1]|nr:MAG: hypothetical protein CVV28_06925 [Methanobacteriales archaeon HGW-Methanobacteriales-1]
MKELLKSFITSFLVIVLANLFLLSINKIIGTSFIGFKIPYYIWILLIILIIMTLILYSYQKQRKNRKNASISPYGIVPHDGWQKISYLPYAGVLWEVKKPNPNTFSGTQSNYIDISLPPLCSKCRTELEEQDNFFWYTLKCIDCGFKKRNKDSYYQNAERVERLAKKRCNK